MFVMVLVLAGVAARDNGQPMGAAKDDMQRLQGTWIRETPVFGGKRIDTLTFKGGRVVWKLEGRNWGRTRSLEVENTYTLDPSHDPKRITMKLKSLPPEFGAIGPLMVLLAGDRTGSYALDGDTFRLVFARSGQEPPKDFKGKPDEYGPFAFKRVKPAPKP